MGTFENRFWSKIHRGDAADCWYWQASMSSGYGQVGLHYSDGRRRKGYAHRIAYELAVGPIPDGLTIDHLCRNRRCCNPAHLEPVTRAENTRRQMAIFNGRCKLNHELRVLSSGRRICYECRNRRRREAHARGEGQGW